MTSETAGEESGIRTGRPAPISDFLGVLTSSLSPKQRIAQGPTGIPSGHGAPLRQIPDRTLNQTVFSIILFNLMMWLRTHCGRRGAYHGFSTPSLDAWAEFCRNAEGKDKSTHATLTRGSVCGSVAGVWATGPTAQGEWKGGYGVFRTEADFAVRKFQI